MASGGNATQKHYCRLHPDTLTAYTPAYEGGGPRRARQQWEAWRRLIQRLKPPKAGRTGLRSTDQ